MRNIFQLFIVLTFIAASCTTAGPSGIFGKRSPHEAYGDKIRSAGLNETAMGRQWFALAEQSLISPVSVNLPYSETGYFEAGEPKAVGILFKAKRGEALTISLQKKPATGFAVYLDLWEAGTPVNPKPNFLQAGDTTTATLKFDVDKEGSYIIRLQPELLKGGEYTLSISTGPSLAFPVSPKVKSNIGSFWGSGRDAGARKHEGIDIFAHHRAPLVAAADGVITRVNVNTLGGKVVFLRPDGKDYSLYYAHLDEQLVQPGQTVKTGDTVGLMGNTGNAKYTSPHLHFGIYTTGGAIDPLPFVNRVTKNPDKITAPLNNLGNYVRNNKSVNLLTEPNSSAESIQALEANTILRAEAATAGWYKVTLTDGIKGFVPGSAVSAIKSELRKARLKIEQGLLDYPASIGARKAILSPGQTIRILGIYKDYYYVNQENKEGWLPKVSL